MAPDSGKPSFCVAGTTSDAPEETALVSRLKVAAKGRSWACRYADVCQDDEINEVAGLVLVVGAGVDSVRRRFPHALLIASEPEAGIDLVVPDAANKAAIDSLLSHSENHWRRNHKVMELFREVGARRQRMSQLSDIALSLSTKMEYSDLLETILREARRLAGCEAGSLYLIDESEDEPALVFKLAQNDCRDFPFIEQRLPLTAESLAGYVALTGDELDIPDVYHLPDGTPYRFNRSFADLMNYRTASMLVLPMRDHRDRVVGVLQFINRIDPTHDAPIPFGEELVEILRAVASQAAV
ncbi:MAG: GAF domain-containing protein, partial [Gammaproteobacteria bacterium]